MRPHRSGLALALVILAAPPLGSQELPLFQTGDTLRIRAPGVQLRNARVTFSGWGDSTLGVRTVRDDSTIAVPFPLVIRLDRFAGKNRLKGAARGAGVFGAVGMLVGIAVGKSSVAGCQEFLCELDAITYAGAGMLVGMVVGAPIGAAGMAPDRWKRVELPVALGFPSYRRPFFETTAFRILFGLGTTLFMLAVS